MDIDVFDLLDERPDNIAEDDGDGGGLFASDSDDTDAAATAGRANKATGARTDYDNDSNDPPDGGAAYAGDDDVDVDVSGAGGGSNPSAAGATAARKKRTVRVQPKLNADRLLGRRGLVCVRAELGRLVFQPGRGHERANLRRLMVQLQHWCHRLFPSMTFDRALERIERLGKSKEIQVNVKKMRMGLEVVPRSDLVVDQDDDQDDGEDDRMTSQHGGVGGGDNRDSTDVFDELMARGRLSPPPVSTAAAAPAAAPAAPVPAAAGDDDSSTLLTHRSTLSDEQRDRIRRNREAAQLRRMRAKFNTPTPTSATPSAATATAVTAPSTAAAADTVSADDSCALPSAAADILPLSDSADYTGSLVTHATTTATATAATTTATTTATVDTATATATATAATVDTALVSSMKAVDVIVPADLDELGSYLQ